MIPPELANSQLPDITVKVVQDATDVLDSMIMEATIEYPVNPSANNDLSENNNGAKMSSVKSQASQEDSSTNLLRIDTSSETVNEKIEASRLKDCIIKLTDLSAEE